jgi:hypothetical protein
MRTALDGEPELKGKYSVVDVMRAYQIYQNDSLEDVIQALLPNFSKEPQVSLQEIDERRERLIRVQAAIEVLKKGDLWPVAPGLLPLFWLTGSGK